MTAHGSTSNMNAAKLGGACDNNLRALPSFAISAIIADDELDGDSLLDDLFQEGLLCSPEAPSNNIPPEPALDCATPLSVRADLPLDRSGHPPRKTLDYLDGKLDANLLMRDDRDDSLDMTRPKFDLHPAKPRQKSSTRRVDGPGGRPRSVALKNGVPRCNKIVLKQDGVLKFTPVIGIQRKNDIVKKHLACIPDARKSQGGTVNPLLGYSVLKLFKSEYVAIAREMWPTSTIFTDGEKERRFVEKTAKKNLGKFWCENAMASDPKTSKKGIYTLTFNPDRFDFTAVNLMSGGNPSAGRPNLIVVALKF